LSDNAQVNTPQEVISRVYTPEELQLRTVNNIPVLEGTVVNSPITAEGTVVNTPITAEATVVNTPILQGTVVNNTPAVVSRVYTPEELQLRTVNTSETRSPTMITNANSKRNKSNTSKANTNKAKANTNKAKANTKANTNKANTNKANTNKAKAKANTTKKKWGDGFFGKSLFTKKAPEELKLEKQKKLQEMNAEIEKKQKRLG
jgi:hypothetical protein